MIRTVTCGQLRKEDAGKTVVLNGWVHRNRDHGGIHFINLRDRYGITQVFIGEDAPEELKETAKNLKYEYCVAIEGEVIARPDSMVNSNMPTGAVEISAKKIDVLSKCEVLPFVIDGDAEPREDLRLKYRYLDLRTQAMQESIKLRTKVSFAAREFLNQKDFYELETPTLIKSTPEGARDFLVPSRLNPGKFYALPQSPQLYKQLLMVSGFDKYFQLAHCFRDEDARGDRQLEHTQIDIEMSFVSKEQIFELIEGLMSHIFKSTMGIDIQTPFMWLPYDDAINLYGSDKPDLRFEMAMQDFSPYVEGADFKVFKDVLAGGGVTKALVVPGAAADYSRKKITELEDHAKIYGAKGLAWMKVTNSGFDGGVGKFYNSQVEAITSGLGAKEGDLILLMASDWKTACTSLGAVRNKLGHDLGLINENEFKFAWIVDFPLFEWNEDEQKWDPAHHMFSMPQEKYLATMEENPGEVKGDLYDLVCNGTELASGSIRIHDPEIQQRIFNIVGFAKEEAEERFGFLLNAFKYGPPPHGGIAPGLDRLVMIMLGRSSIRDVILFPKNSFGISPMDDCPSEVDESQLKELCIELNLPEKEEKE